MSQWAEIRHLHLVDGVPKKEIAPRLKLDVKTVRREQSLRTLDGDGRISASELRPASSSNSTGNDLPE